MIAQRCRFARPLALTLLAAAAPLADAGQPLVTDDAAVVAPKTCQLEAWGTFAHDGRLYWAQPGCNFGGNVEFDVGAARVRPDAEAASSIINLQVKAVLASLADGAWAFGALAGTGRATGAPRGGPAFQAYYAKALASWYPRDDLEIDLNLGAANVYGLGSYALAGAAIQYAIVPSLQLLAEVYRDEPGRGKYQAGARWIVIPDRLEAYASYGNRFTGSTQPWSVIVGIRLQTPAFLP